MLTGQDVKLYFQQRADFSYTGYLDDQKLNKMFRNGIYLACDKKYLTLEEQKTFDEMAALITTKQVYQINNNQIATAPTPIVSIIQAGLALIVTTYFPHNLVTGDLVDLSNIQGVTTTPTVNGTFSVTTITPTKFRIIINSGSAAGYVANTGQVVHAKLIADYLHIYAVRCKFIEPLLGLVATRTQGFSPINVYFSARNKIRTYQQIQLANISPANGTWYARQLNHTGVSLWTDADLTSPSTGGVDADGLSGRVNLVWYEDAKPKFADRNIDPYEKETVELPKFETAGKFLKFYPDNRVCSEITIAYFTKPPKELDVTDSTTDLELWYPAKFIYYMTDVILRLFSTPLRDTLLSQEVSQELIENP